MVCPKCTALSEMLTISVLTITPDSIPYKNLPLKIKNLLLLPLKSISIPVSKTLTKIDNADLHAWSQQRAAISINMSSSKAAAHIASRTRLF